jgi:hypothetical protein
MRIGMFLEIATTIGAIAGALIAARVSTSTIAIVFGFVLLYSAYLSVRPQPPHPVVETQDRLARFLRLDGDYPTPQGSTHYTVHRIPLGFGLMFGAGTLSGLLGIGSGAVKVLAMDQAMRIPFKVSTTTSNFMIGVTAAASAGVYLARGYIDPGKPGTDGTFSDTRGNENVPYVPVFPTFLLQTACFFCYFVCHVGISPGRAWKTSRLSPYFNHSRLQTSVRTAWWHDWLQYRNDKSRGAIGYQNLVLGPRSGLEILVVAP